MIKKAAMPRNCAAAISLLFILSAHAQSDVDAQTGHTVQNRARTDQVAAPRAQPPKVQLGAAADEQSAKKWRTRRGLSQTRLLAPQLHVEENETGELVFGPGEIPEPEVEIGYSFLKNGNPTTSLLSVGMLLGGQSEDTAYSRCTVTLTKPDTVITARHCLAYPHGDSFWVYFPYGGVRRVADNGISFFCEKDDPGCSVKVDDLAIVTLEAPYAILPTALPGTPATAVAKQKATIVGYGLNSPDLADYGIKREGQIELSACEQFPPDGLSLCFKFASDTNSGTEDNGVGIHVNCNNDSGGPMLTPVLDSEKVIGISSQLAGSCDSSGEGRYVNATNSHYQTWLKDAYCDPFCLTQTDLVLSELLIVPIAHLNETDASSDHEFVVAEGTISIIVTLNHGRGWYPFPNNLDLTLPSLLDPTCTQFVEVEICTADAPPAGTYDAIVTRVHGEAEYQLSAVAFAAAFEPEIAPTGVNETQTQDSQLPTNTQN